MQFSLDVVPHPSSTAKGKKLKQVIKLLKREPTNAACAKALGTGATIVTPALGALGLGVAGPIAAGRAGARVVGKAGKVKQKTSIYSVPQANC